MRTAAAAGPEVKLSKPTTSPTQIINCALLILSIARLRPSFLEKWNKGRSVAAEWPRFELGRGHGIKETDHRRHAPRAGTRPPHREQRHKLASFEVEHGLLSGTRASLPRAGCRGSTGKSLAQT